MKEAKMNERITLGNFIEFNHFLEDIEQIKRKVSLYKSLDYDMFEEIFIDYKKYQQKQLKANKGRVCPPEHFISEIQIKALFMMLDDDESGDVDEGEIMAVL